MILDVKSWSGGRWFYQNLDLEVGAKKRSVRALSLHMRT